MNAKIPQEGPGREAATRSVIAYVTAQRPAVDEATKAAIRSKIVHGVPHASIDDLRWLWSVAFPGDPITTRKRCSMCHGDGTITVANITGATCRECNGRGYK